MRNAASYSLLLLVSIAAGSGLALPQSQPPDSPKEKPRLDALGDPLPSGAVARLGTRRFQVASNYVQKPISVAGGKQILFAETDLWGPGKRSGFHWMDAVSGKVLEVNAELLEDPPRIGEKVREEADEVTRAAADESDQRLREEAADVLYHLTVLMASRGLALSDAYEELNGRRR